MKRNLFLKINDMLIVFLAVFPYLFLGLMANYRKLGIEILGISYLALFFLLITNFIVSLMRIKDLDKIDMIFLAIMPIIFIFAIIVLVAGFLLSIPS